MSPFRWRTELAYLFALSLALFASSSRAVTVSTSPVSRDTTEQLFARLVEDGSGAGFLTWLDRHTSSRHDAMLTRLRADGSPDPAWPAGGTRLHGVLHQHSVSRSAPDGQGGAYVLIHCSAVDSLTTRQMLVHITASGTVDPAFAPNGILVHSNPTRFDVGQVIPDRHGGVFVALIANEAGFNGLARVVAFHFLGHGGRDPSWPASGLNLAVGRPSQVMLLPDRADGLVVLWLDQTGDALQPNVVRGVRLTAAGVAHPGWLAPGPDLTPTDNIPRWAAATDGEGGAFVAWLGIPTGGPGGFGAPPFRAVRLVHVRHDGTPDPGYPAAGQRLSETAYSAYDAPAVCADGVGGAFVAWQDIRDGHEGPDLFWVGSNIGMHHVRSDGSRTSQWPDSGFIIASGPGEQREPGLVTDHHGGAFLIWRDERSAGESDILAHHVRSTDLLDPDLPLSGLEVCGVAHPQLRPAAVATSAGVLVAWEDFRDGTRDPVDPAMWAGSDLYAAGVDIAPPVQVAQESPVLQLSLGRAGAGALRVRYALVSGEDARLSVFDLAGRRLARLVLSSASRTADVKIGELRPGVVLVQLSQGAHRIVARGVVLR